MTAVLLGRVRTSRLDRFRFLAPARRLGWCCGRAVDESARTELSSSWIPGDIADHRPKAVLLTYVCCAVAHVSVVISVQSHCTYSMQAAASVRISRQAAAQHQERR